MHISTAIVGLSLLLQAAAPTAQPSPAAATAATQAAVEAPAAQTAPSATVKLAAGTVLKVELVDTLSSATAQLSGHFKIRLVEPISSDGVEIVAAGALGEGEIVDAKKAGMGGREGKLVVAARFLDLNGTRARVRGMAIGGSGDSRVDTVTALSMVPYVGLVTPFIQGGENIMPTGTRATVRLAQDVDVPRTPPAEPAVAPTAPVPPTETTPVASLEKAQ